MLPVIILPDSASSAEGERRPVHLWMLVVSTVMVCASGAVHLMIFKAGQSFENLFRGFGADLPILTKFVLGSYQTYGLLFLVTLLPCVLLFLHRVDFVSENSRRFKFVTIGFGLSLSISTVFVAAMYLPIFQMGAVVQ